VKRHVLTDGRGVPLSLVVTGANVHDQKGLKALLRGIPVRRPRPRSGRPQTLCLDKGYDSPACRKELRRRGYRDGTKSRGTEKQEKRRNPLKRARRWVVERTHSWMTNWRKVLVRYEKKASNYLAMLQIVSAICSLRAAGVLG
jgi:transposase